MENGDCAEGGIGCRALLDAIYDAVLVVGGDGTILSANARAGELFDAGGATLPGLPVYPLFALAPEETKRRAAHVAAEGGFRTVETRCIRRDGSSFQGELAIGRVDAARAKPRLCFLVRDISIRHKAQHDLQHALERMEALGRARMEFVSNASHELRTPLTSMIYAVRNMERGLAGPIGERAMQYLARLESDCNRLLGTVNDMLDLRQIENRTLTLAKRRVAPLLAARDAADSLRIQSDAKNLQVGLGDVARIDFAMADPAKLERIFINIIGNAIKFTPSGGKISISATPVPNLPGMVAVEVSDTGLGIPPEDIPKVTARFFQVGDQPIGTGLGLAITKELVELHGGKLIVESPVPGTNAGTRVTVALPAIGGPRILVVAASGSECAAAAEAALAARSIPAVRFAGGHAAIRDCIERTPDIVAVCGDTDDLTAAEFVMRIRNDRRLRHLPLVYFQSGATGGANARMMDAFGIPVVPPSADEREAVAATLRAMRR